MEFDISRVYSAVNADDLKVGSKVIVAAQDSLDALRRCVIDNKYVYVLKQVRPENYMSRFVVESRFLPNEDSAFTLCYLISEPGEPKLKWTDLKICDVVRNVNTGVELLITGIDRRDNPQHVKIGDTWVNDLTLVNWEKVNE